jgi:hypothetical protein
MTMTNSPKDKDHDQYSEKEAKRRFKAALRGGLSTPPKPLKSPDFETKKARRKKRS